MSMQTCAKGARHTTAMTFFAFLFEAFIADIGCKALALEENGGQTGLTVTGIAFLPGS